jgi:fructose-specific phosphotransferase system IIA component
VTAFHDDADIAQGSLFRLGKRLLIEARGFIMKLCQYVRKDLVIINFEATDKIHAFRRIASAFREAGLIRDETIAFNSIMAREELMTTAVGKGVAVPHAAVPEIQDMAIAVAILNQELDFQSLDQRPVKLIVMIIVNDQRTDLSLKALAGITRMVSHTDLVERLRGATDPDQVISILQESEGQIIHH